MMRRETCWTSEPRKLLAGMSETVRTLVIGYGNPARGDDGLGPAFVEQLDTAQLTGVDTRTNYQLCVEDAMDLAGFEQVVFVDAARHLDQPFIFYPVDESRVPDGLDTHSLSPEAVVHLSRSLFGTITRAFVLAIQGNSFDQFEEQLSAAAQHNLQSALDYFISGQQSGRLYVPAIDRALKPLQ